MVGFPKTLSSRQDYEFIRNNCSEEAWRNEWQLLLDSAYMWVEAGKISDEEAGIIDDTHRISSTIDEEGVECFIQYERIFNKTCKMARLGFTEDYVKSILG